MLARRHLTAGEAFGLSHRRQARALALFIGDGVVAILLVEGEKPVEEDDGAVRAQPKSPGGVGDVDSDLLEQRRGHLARDGPFPDQLVEPSLILVEISDDIRGLPVEVSRTDRFMGLLSVLGRAAVSPRRIRQVTWPELAANEMASGRDRLAREIDPLVQPLRDLHRAAG